MKLRKTVYQSLDEANEMLTREYGKIVFECDRCGGTLDTNTAEWSEALHEFTLDGWRATKYGKDWTHLCDACEYAATCK